MKIDFNSPLTKLDGESLTQVTIGWMQAASFTFNRVRAGADLQSVLKEIEKEEGTALTLGDACVEALLNTQSANKADGKEKLRRYRLAKRISEGGTITLSTKDDCTFLDTCLAEYLNATGYGSANALLFPDEPDVEEAAE